MTTYVDFVPSLSAPFQFQATLDGGAHQMLISWNVAAQRWYLNVATLSGIAVATVPLIGSGDWIAAELTTTAGSPLAYAASPTAGQPIGLQQGQSIMSANVAPATIMVLAGTVLRMSAPATASGTDAGAMFGFDIDLIGGYFATSTLVYRESVGRFEVTP